MLVLLGVIKKLDNKVMHDIKKNQGGEKMKKLLAKKMKKSSNAIRYFSGENLTKPMYTVDTSCYLVISVSSCAC